MGFFRFRRSIKLFPGVRWNFGKKSTSLSIGGRGANYTVGTSGSRTTVGIPGTGLSYTDIHSSHSRVKARHPRIPEPSESWLRNNRINVTISTPDRQPGEAPIRPDQLDTIKSITPDFSRRERYLPIINQALSPERPASHLPPTKSDFLSEDPFETIQLDSDTEQPKVHRHFFGLCEIPHLTLLTLKPSMCAENHTV